MENWQQGSEAGTLAKGIEEGIGINCTIKIVNWMEQRLTFIMEGLEDR